MMPTAMKMNMPAAPNGRSSSGMRLKTTTSSIASMDSVGRALSPATRSANISLPFSVTGMTARALKVSSHTSCALRMSPARRRVTAGPGRRLHPKKNPRSRSGRAGRSNLVSPAGRRNLGGGALGGLLDAALEAARVGRQLGVRHRQQVGVEAAIVLDGADRIHGEAELHQLPERVRQEARHLPAGHEPPVGLV